jgi:hypothetical protein
MLTRAGLDLSGPKHLAHNLGAGGGKEVNGGEVRQR